MLNINGFCYSYSKFSSSSSWDYSSSSSWDYSDSDSDGDLGTFGIAVFITFTLIIIIVIYSTVSSANKKSNANNNRSNVTTTNNVGNIVDKIRDKLTEIMIYKRKWYTKLTDKINFYLVMDKN